jgi:hypothetical protein
MLKDIDCLQVSVMFSEDMPLKSAEGQRILGGLQSPPVFKDIQSSCEFLCFTVLPIVLPPFQRSLQVEVANVQAAGAFPP